ncbi:HIT family protein [Streptacidiphilus sp. EB103A]|uniref:HIT family protein n=1 Tax=Streptacidiphilus sp. EB103A TaxID=3156275 RepID=UPI003516AD86
MPVCELCQAIDPAVRDCSLQRHLHSGQQRIVTSSRHATAVPTIGAFTPGYLLVVPTRHVPSLGLLSDEELMGVEHLSREVADRLHFAYRRPILAFEYGLNLPRGRRIAHGHLHMLPTTADLAHWLQDRLEGYEITGLTGLPRTADASYIAVQDQSGELTCYPVPNDAEPRLRLREVVAALDPRIEDTAWDWQRHPFPEQMRATVDDLLPLPRVGAVQPQPAVTR